MLKGGAILLKFIRVLFVCLALSMSFSAPVLANEGDEIFDEQQSISDDKADDAYDSITDKLEPDNIYDGVMDQVNKGKGQNPFKAFLRGFYSVYGYLRTLSPILIIGAIVIGVLIAIFSRKNKGLRRFGITIAIVIPILVVLVVFGIGYLNSVFLH